MKDNKPIPDRDAASLAEDDDAGGVKALLELGKHKGFVTLEDVDDLLDPTIVEQEDIEEVLTVLGDEKVEVRGEAEAPSKDGGDEAGAVPEQRAAGEVDQVADYVRMYMRDMGAVPLLSREGEVVIAKRIEAAELCVFELVFKSALGRRFVEWLSSALAAGEVRVRSVVKVTEPEPEGGYEAAIARDGVPAVFIGRHKQTA